MVHELSSREEDDRNLERTRKYLVALCVLDEMEMYSEEIKVDQVIKFHSKRFTIGA